MPLFQVRVHSDGGAGAAAAGLSLSEHQPAGGEFSQHAASAAGGRQTAPPHPRHQLCAQHTRCTTTLCNTQYTEQLNSGSLLTLHQNKKREVHSHNPADGSSILSPCIKSILPIFLQVVFPFNFPSKTISLNSHWSVVPCPRSDLPSVPRH